MRTVIGTPDLRKTFGSTVALDGLDLTVHEGAIHGFLGPNGAGKSTTIRILLGLTRSDGGTATVLGGDPWQDATELHRRIAYVPGDVALWPNLTGGETIDLLARLRAGMDERRRRDLVERFGLDPTKKGRRTPRGNRQKVPPYRGPRVRRATCCSSTSTTAGLDPLMERAFQDELAPPGSAGTRLPPLEPHAQRSSSACDR